MERGLTFTGMVGIKDPARPEVAGAIARCRAAGIRVIMITGDSAPTASAIARDVGVFAEGEPLTLTLHPHPPPSPQPQPQPQPEPQPEPQP